MKKERIISYRANCNFKEVPYIRLSGKWLQDMGFTIGSNFTVITDKNTVSLKLVNKKESINDTNTSV